jgi:hypothetical protein
MKKTWLSLFLALAMLLAVGLAAAGVSSCIAPTQATALTTTSGETATLESTTSETTPENTSETTPETTSATTTGTTTGETTTVESSAITPTTRGDMPAPDWSVANTAKDFLDTDNTKLMEVSYNLPRISNTDSWPAFALINIYYENLADKALKHDQELAADAVKDRADLGENFFVWYDYLTGEVTWQSTYLVSITVAQEYYCGGVHPNNLLSSVCFDLYTGLPVPLASFFTIPENDVIDQLLDLVYQQTSTLTDESGALIYDCSLDTLHAYFKPGNFYLTDEGFVIYYQPYDIAPYAAGLPEFLIPYDQLAGILRSDILD